MRKFRDVDDNSFAGSDKMNATLEIRRECAFVREYSNVTNTMKLVLIVF